MNNISYWIQDKAKLGYFDSIGLSPETTRESAIEQLMSWRKTFPERESRLVIRVDIQLLPLPK